MLEKGKMNLKVTGAAHHVSTDPEIDQLLLADGWIVYRSEIEWRGKLALGRRGGERWGTLSENRKERREEILEFLVTRRMDNGR